MTKIFLSIVCGLILYVPTVQAQFDAQSKKILDQVTALYQSYRTVEADILLSIKHPQEKTQSSTGTLAMERASGKFKIKLAGHEIINNGQTQWTILKDQQEVQVNNAEKDDQALSPATIFTFYKNGYKGIYIGQRELGGKTLNIVSLVPTDDTQNVSKIELYVQEKTSLVDHVTVFDTNDGELTYSVRNLVSNRLIPYSTFLFDTSLYPGMEIVDLR